MKTYTVLAEDVPHYGTLDIEVADDESAIAFAKAQNASTIACDPDWDNSTCQRIVHIQTADGRIVAEDIALDDCIARHGGEADRTLCDAAPGLIEALRKIAAIPLWNEAIADEALKAELIDAGEYDAGTDSFNPSCDTESSHLEYAVETARAALAQAEGGAP